MIPGTEIEADGQTWTVPPLSLRQMREFLPKIQQLSASAAGSLGPEELDILTELVAAAMRRNYPEMTAEKVEDMLDLTSAIDALNAAMGRSKSDG
jgi:hypothetical protein